MTTALGILSEQAQHRQGQRQQRQGPGAIGPVPIDPNEEARAHGLL